MVGQVPDQAHFGGTLSITTLRSTYPQRPPSRYTFKSTIIFVLVIQHLRTRELSPTPRLMD